MHGANMKFCISSLNKIYLANTILFSIGSATCNLKYNRINCLKPITVQLAVQSNISNFYVERPSCERNMICISFHCNMDSGPYYS